ncbi:MAG TPA: TlpA disulfide reductase family protein [Acidimicrobiales bacterium]|nr:TlpA disulfide reductase family protein [Acidimicrobiales bacterium]
MRSRVALISAVALAIVLGAFVVVLATSKPSTTRLAETPLLGKQAPSLGGDVVAGEDRWTIVNIFATWCIPCVQEHDDLVAFSNNHAVTGDAEVVSVVFSDDREDVEAFFDERGGDWPVIYDDDGRIATDWGVTGVPESYLVAPDGSVRAKIVGGIVLEKLEELLAEARGA